MRMGVVAESLEDLYLSVEAFFVLGIETLYCEAPVTCLV